MHADIAVFDRTVRFEGYNSNRGPVQERNEFQFSEASFGKMPSDVVNVVKLGRVSVRRRQAGQSDAFDAMARYIKSGSQVAGFAFSARKNKTPTVFTRSEFQSPRVRPLANCCAAQTQTLNS